MRTPVQVINVVDRAQPFRVKSRDLPGHRVYFFGNAQLRRTAPYVIARMRPALPFGHALNGRCPRVGSFSGGIIDRKAEVITQFRTRTALGFVFIKSRRPFAREIDLSKGGDTAGNRYYNYQKGQSVDRHASLLETFGNFTPDAVLCQ